MNVEFLLQALLAYHMISTLYAWSRTIVTNVYNGVKHGEKISVTLDNTMNGIGSDTCDFFLNLMELPQVKNYVPNKIKETVKRWKEILNK